MTTVEHDPLLGTTLAGRYRIAERIGAGAMGAVYRATQVGLGREVALKVLKKQAGASEDVVARFEREAKAMSALSHPNTVRVYDFGATPQGLLFLAMELLEGELATARLTKPAGVRPPDAIQWVRQVLRSLGEAHAKGIIHRDIKPDNIFLARVPGQSEPVVKVLDFGIAKAVRGEHKLDQFETQDGTVFGTPRYMSPEQAQGKPLDLRSDLYAVGILLYELLIGTPPFVDRDAVVVMAKHIRELPQPLHVAAPARTFPASLQRVLDKALAKVPDERFQNADEFERALAPCLRDAALIERAPERGRPVLASALSAPRWALCLGAGFVLFALASTLIASTHVGGAAAAGDAVKPSRVAGPSPAAIAQPDQAAKPAAAEPKFVTVQSDPSGANVWSEGRFAGTTPLALAVPPERSLRVQLSLPGFTSQTLDLSAAESTRAVTLAAAPPPAVPAAAGAAAVAASGEAERPRKKRRGSKSASADKPRAYEKF